MTPREALELSKNVSEEIERAVKKIVGKDEAGITVGIGKDGTPTKKIDRIAEEIAIRILREHDLRIVSEESGVVGDGDVWVALDPIDGTFNATRGFPFYGVSLCFSRSQMLRDTFLGFVKNLATGDEYYSDRKAYKNGRKIAVREVDDVECNAIFYYPYKRYPFRRIRILGSASLEICLVAEGSFDCFIDVRKGKDGRGFLRVYDVSASIYIAKNAGAVISSLDGDDIWEKKISMEERFRLLISGRKIHEKLMGLI